VRAGVVLWGDPNRFDEYVAAFGRLPDAPPRLMPTSIAGERSYLEPLTWSGNAFRKFDLQNGNLLALIRGHASKEYLETILARWEHKGLHPPSTTADFQVVLIGKERDTHAVITDHTGFYPLFKWRSDGATILSTAASIRSRIGSTPTLSAESMGTYLANGAAYGKTALFEDVQQLRANRIYTFDGISENEVEYWQYGSADSPHSASRQESVLMDELVGAVARAGGRSESRAIALTGGHDARTIACFAAFTNPGTQVAFTFAGPGRHPRSSDSAVARSIASQCSMPHYVVDHHPEDFWEWVVANGVSGEGLRSFSYELLGFRREAPFPLRSSTVVVGDEFVGSKMNRLSSEHDVLRSLSFLPLRDRLGWAERLFPAETFHDLSAGVDDANSRLVETIDAAKGLRHAREKLFVEVRLPLVLGRLRAMQMTQGPTIVAPLIDKSIIDLVGSLPLSARGDKALFTAAMSHKFPDIFRIRTAKRPTHRFSVSRLLSDNYDRVLHEVESEVQPFDSVVPKETLLSIMSLACSSRPPSGEQARSPREYVAQMLPVSARKRLRRVVSTTGNAIEVPAEDLLVRLLAMRVALSRAT
jgi:hypothetical protein